MNLRVPKRSKNRLGLTLIELLLATSLFAVVGTVLYSILSQGISVWERSQKDDDSASEERIVLERISSDIRNSFTHSWVKFMGKADEIYFCGYKNPLQDIRNREDVLFKIHYFFADENNENYRPGLYVEEYPIQFSFSETPPAPRLLTELFQEFRFEFGYWSPLEEKIIYQDTWRDSKTLPKVIVLKGKSSHEFEKTIALPLGELIEFQEKEEGLEPGQMGLPPSEAVAGTQEAVTIEE
jgi:hypothetical protein